MVTTGGEEAFIMRMIEESLELQNQVQWYTSMAGKLSTVTTVIEKLVQIGNQNWAVAEFVQGSKTRRWAVAWSWQDLRPTNAAARHLSSIPGHLLPFPSEMTFHLRSQSINLLIRKINDGMNALHMSWKWDQYSTRGVGFAMDNVWSRQARRKRQRMLAETGAEEDVAQSIDESRATLGIAVHVRQTGIENVDVIVRWIKGFDSVLFESFCGMFKRLIESQ